MADKEEEDFTTEETNGYKVGEKKTLNELSTLDAQDESLQKWKASLGIGAGAVTATASNGKFITIVSMAMEVADRSDVVLDLSTPGTLDSHAFN